MAEGIGGDSAGVNPNAGPRTYPHTGSGRPRLLTKEIERELLKAGASGDKTRWLEIVEKIVAHLLNSRTKVSDFTRLLEVVLDRVEGKAVGIELTGEIDSPLAQLDWDVLNARVQELKKKYGTLQKPVGD